MAHHRNAITVAVGINMLCPLKNCTVGVGPFTYVGIHMSTFWSVHETLRWGKLEDQSNPMRIPVTQRTCQILVSIYTVGQIFDIRYSRKLTEIA